MPFGVSSAAAMRWPSHWATFVLAYHAWSEPAEVLFEEAARRGVSLATPRLGQPIEVAGPSPTETARLSVSVSCLMLGDLIPKKGVHRLQRS